MKRKMGLLALGLLSLVGCQSNPYRPTLFQRLRGNDPSVSGPELSVPPTGSVQEGPYLGGGDVSGGYPGSANGYVPAQGIAPPQGYPPAGSFVPQGPGSANPPIQGFPQTMPPAPNPNALPQGPPPRTTPNTNGTSR